MSTETVDPITIDDTDIDLAMKDLFTNQLVLWNDDHNAFDFVILMLVTILEHTREQAEQCTLTVHTKGKCTVKDGSLEELKPYKQLLTEVGLSCTIE